MSGLELLLGLGLETILAITPMKLGLHVFQHLHNVLVSRIETLEKPTAGDSEELANPFP